MAKRGSRDLEKESAWRRMVGEQAGSGLSVRAWCRAHGVKESGFYAWRRELARRDAEPVPGPRPASEVSGEGTQPSVGKRARPAASFLPVRVTGAVVAGDDSRLEIVLADGQCVRLTGPVDQQALADVLEVLERRSC